MHCSVYVQRKPGQNEPETSEFEPGRTMRQEYPQEDTTDGVGRKQHEMHPDQTADHQDPEGLARKHEIEVNRQVELALRVAGLEDKRRASESIPVR